MTAIKTYINENKDRFLEELFDGLRIPSVSADSAFKDDMARMAEFYKAAILKAGAVTVDIIETEGHPIVYGQTEIDPNKKTILVYGHYDVQPADPYELWTTPPFEPTIREGKIYARGADDDKGQGYIHIKAVETLKALGELPCNVKFLYEGEEEVGSVNLPPFVEANKEKLACDAVIISDTSMIANNIPSICTGLRGLGELEITLTGPKRDLHSGHYGGAVANPLHELATMIAKLHNEEGRITVPNFYDGIVDLSEEERDIIAKRPFDMDAYKQEIGIKDVFGEAGYSTIERMGIRPTLEVNGMWGGYIGEGGKTVLPSKAHAKLTMRLVPGQDHTKMNDLVADYLKSITPSTMTLDIKLGHTAPAAITSTTSVGYKAAEEAYETVWEKTPIPTKEGGSIPVVSLFQEVLDTSVIMMGFGLESDAIHSPDENFGIENFIKGIETVATFHTIFASKQGNGFSSSYLCLSICYSQPKGIAAEKVYSSNNAFGVGEWFGIYE